MTRKIYLLRHCQTEWNRDKKIQGRMDSPLTTQGENDARTWGTQLAHLGIETIWASPQQRVVDTVERINIEVKAPITYETGLREQDWGEWEGLQLSQIQKYSAKELHKQTCQGWEFRAPLGESRREVFTRAQVTLINSLRKNSEKTILVVCHQGLIKALVYKILGRSFMPHEKKVLKKNALHCISFDDTTSLFAIHGLNLLTATDSSENT